MPVSNELLKWEGRLSAQTFELTLARLYTDPVFRSQFLSDSLVALKNCELTDDERKSLLKIDQAGLLMASHSFLHKRKKRFSNRSVLKKLTFKLKIMFKSLTGRFN